MNGTQSPRRIAFVGSYAGDPGKGETGGITVVEISGDTTAVHLRQLDHTVLPGEAGYLAYATSTGTLYAVDERKNDGRGPVGPAASVHSLTLDPSTGTLTPLNQLVAPGPFPTYLALDERHGWLLTANHGSFDHVEKVRRTEQGTWVTDLVYDDSTVILYRLDTDGRIGDIADLVVLEGHGIDPNTSLQAGGHGQASAHAHSVVIDPSGQFVLVGDKGTDRILVFRLGAPLELESAFEAGAQTGPRHIAFDPATGRAYVTYEFSSELASFDFDPATGQLSLVDRCPTTAGPVGRTNEPADVRVHPAGGLVYVNNRGEDTLAWFRVDAEGRLDRAGDVRLADSIHPGLAARSFAFDRTGGLLLVADRPANLLRGYAVNAASGDLTPVVELALPQPAFVVVAELS